MKLPLISIIIPVYNRADVFLRSLDTAVKQTYRPLEIIVVDDGSTQKFQISNFKFQNDLNTTITLYKQENKGAPAARNKGFALSKGEYVIFWDADVMAQPEMLEKMYDALQKNKNVDFVYCNFKLDSILMKGREWDVEELKKVNYIMPTTLMKRDAFTGFDESLKKFQDWDLFLTMAEQGKKGVWIDEILFTTIGGGTMSSWLPSFAYKKPWKWFPGIRSRVKKYEEAKKIIYQKHVM